MEKLYKKARSLVLEENFNQAAILFTRFIKKYPHNELADNSVYWLGECHYSMGDYKGAVKIFKGLVIKEPVAVNTAKGVVSQLIFFFMVMKMHLVFNMVIHGGDSGKNQPVFHPIHCPEFSH